MNWSKAKSILIIFFLLMNMILVFNIIYSANKATAITPEILNSTVEVLAKNDISIDENIIPRKIIDLPYVEVSNIIVSNDEFAKKLLPDGYDVADNTYIGKNASLTINGDKFVFTADTPILSEITNTITADTAKKTALAILEKYSLALGKYQYSVEEVGQNFEVKFKKIINSTAVFDSEIKMILSKNGLTEISGSWFNESGAGGLFSKKIPLNSITGVLVEFILNEQRPKNNITVQELNLGYCTGDESIYHKSVVLTPVWEIVLSDNSRYYADARD